MKLFLDRNRTLLPRVDVIYLVTRTLTLIGFSWFAYDSGFIAAYPTTFWLVFATFVAHLGVFTTAMRGNFDLKLAYLSAIIYDLMFVPVAISLAGGLASSMYLLFFITISVAAYVLTFWFATVSVALVSAAYVYLVVGEVSIENALDFGLRLAFLWAYYLAISYVSRYLRKSEARLIKLFNTLNLRTAELEKSQAQLEVFYENTRTLGGILDEDGIVKELIRIMSNTLRYQYCAVVQLDRWNHFYYRARSMDGRPNWLFKAIDHDGSELIKRVIKIEEPVRVKDIAARDDYRPMEPKARSALLVPMIAHGKPKGVLIAESIGVDHFTERDMQQFTSVARSAAMALDNAELHRRTEELTMIDELTATYNYRYFVHKLEEEKKRALRYDLPLSIIMVDIDWFKKINDSYGHESGNVVLRELSNVIKRCIRDVDIFCRYGGEEFAVILPQTAKMEAEHIGERIRSQVEEMIINTEKDEKLKITVSVGVSAYPENGRSHEDLVTAADQALYRAKGSGKNLVCSV
ncbi:sensor domain-containing diguanylate cyclase [bacterium]|nr:sensor domain-containing diguanylate cyclase [bacterium]